MKTIIIGLIVIANLIFQPTLLGQARIFNVIPNTSLILVVCFAINTNKNKGALIGFIIGILQDITFGKLIGLNALIYMIAGYLIAVINRNVFKENLAIPFVFTALATVFYYSVGLFFIYFLGYNLEFFNVFRHTLIIEIIYNCIISIFIYVYVSKIFKSTRKRY